MDFEEWYRAAHPRVLAALVAYCGDYSAASEATDEAFVRAFSRWARVGAMASPAGWTFVVARNVLRRGIARSARNLVAWSHQSSDGSPVAVDESARVEAALEVSRALGLLTRRQRDVVVLYHGFDLTQDCVAELLGISRSTVATTLLDARRALGLRLEQKGETCV
jgi:RNA polymerase sigma-70 factor (ECF subfamily)